MAETKIKNVPYDVVNYKGEKVGTIELSEELVNIEEHPASVQLAVRCQLANQRQATAKTKTRAEVRGGGKKPWRQKGTGRARAGSSRSPIWVGGGTVFGPTGIQNFKLKVNNNVHSLALTSVIAEKLRNKNVIFVDNSEVFPTCKTKDVREFLNKVNAAKKTLIVIDVFADKTNENLYTGARNLENVTVVGSDNISVYDIVNNQTVIFERSLAPMFQLEEAN